MKLVPGKLIILIPLLSFQMVAAQFDAAEESRLHEKLLSAPNDTVTMAQLYALGWYYTELNHDSAIYYFERALPIARKFGLLLYEADIEGMRGYLFLKLGDYPKSLESFLRSIKIPNDPASEGTYWPGQRSREVQLGWSYHHTAVLYYQTGKWDVALDYYNKSRAIGKSAGEQAMVALVEVNLGQLYTDMGLLDSALFLEQKALEFYINSPFWKKYDGYVLNFIGEIYKKRGELELSKKTFRRSITSSAKINNLLYLGDAYLSLANLYHSLEQLDSSMFYAKESLHPFRVLKNAGGRLKAYRLMTSFFEKKGHVDSAFFYLKLASYLDDSLKNVEIQNLTAYQNLGFQEQHRLEQAEAAKAAYENRVRTYFFIAGIFVLLLISVFLYINNQLKQKSRLRILKAYDNLKATQQQLIQSEKMASLGELTAGIAHEIQNPLNFVNNFSEINQELIEELKSEKLKVKSERDEALEVDLLNDIAENEKKINHHGKRADAIVKGMLQHSRSSTGTKEPTDINALVDEYLRLSYHGLRAKDKSFNAAIETDYDQSIGNIDIIPQDIGRVVLNLINNAFYAVQEQTKAGKEGYEPTVSVSTKKSGNQVTISVKDNGPGIPSSIKDKIFQPFFTTKPTGQGTGLGLSLSYDIVKAHGGEMKVDSSDGTGTEFVIQLPFV